MIKRALTLAINGLASYGFACIIFILLMVLTFLGTIEQVDQGLYEVQKRYFESMFVVHKLFGVIPLLLPGVYLLLILFSVNLILGGIIRMRKNKYTVGNFIVHAGMLLLILGGLIKSEFSVDGHLTLAENERSSEFQSYYLWEIALSPVDDKGQSTTEYLIADDQFVSAHEANPVTFVRDDVPFDLTVTRFLPNCEPSMVGPVIASNVHSVDGFFLNEMAKDKEAERNTAGVHVQIRDKATGSVKEAILYGRSQSPLPIDAGGQQWTLDLRNRRYTFPFTIALNKFIQEKHPRMQMAKMFSSEVTKIENGIEQPVTITMNEPLRHKGYTFFQASFIEADPQRGIPVMSTLAVVRDPADRIPLYSCIVISIGLMLHFTMKLGRYLRREQKRLEPSRAT